MPAAMPLTTKISKSSSRTTDYRVLRSQYGNGYEQRAQDGLNARDDRAVIVWENITITDFNTVKNALNTAGGVDYFNWQPWDEAVSMKWVQEAAMQVSPQSAGLYSISVPFRRVYDLG